MRYAKIDNGRLIYPTGAEFPGVPHWDRHDGLLRRHGYRPLEELKDIRQDEPCPASQPSAVPSSMEGDGGAIPSTALVTCHYGGFSKLRRDATLRAVKAWDAQEYRPGAALFLELVCPWQDHCFEKGDFPPWMQYVRIYGNASNENLFQKEALWNLGAKLTDAEKIFFLDGDCMPVECPDYFKRIFDACAVGRCVHAAWHIVHEGQQPGSRDYYSFFADSSDVPAGSVRFPGMGYCLTRQDYNAIDGFNPFSICGSGDAVFLWESLKCVPQPMTYAKRFHQSLIRPHQPQLEPVCLKGLTVQHNYHGLKSDRGYVWSRYAVELFGDPKAYCHIDGAGLVAWNDPEFPLKYIVMQKARMHTKEELLALICEVVRKRLDWMESRSRNKDYHYDRTEEFYG